MSFRNNPLYDPNVLSVIAQYYQSTPAFIFDFMRELEHHNLRPYLRTEEGYQIHIPEFGQYQIEDMLLDVSELVDDVLESMYRERNTLTDTEPCVFHVYLDIQNESYLLYKVFYDEERITFTNDEFLTMITRNGRRTSYGNRQLLVIRDNGDVL